MRTPRLLRIPATIGAYESDVVKISYKPAMDERIAIIGMSCSQKPALYTHECLDMSQASDQAVTVSTIGETDYGIPFGAICNLEKNSNWATVGVEIGSRKFQPWAGRINNPFDYRELLEKAQSGQQLTQAESNRLMLARAVPVEGFAAWPLQSGVEWSMTLKRIYGATAISKIYLYAIVLPADFDIDELTDRPHWLGQALTLANTAQVEDSPTILRWVGQSNRALRVNQIFNMGYSNNGGVIAYDADYSDAVSLKILEQDGTGLLPHFASRRVPLYELSNQILQHTDVSKDPALIIAENSSIQLEAESSALTYQKDVRLAFYGLIRPQDRRTKQILDVA